jgi:hypothetical protein
MEKQTFRTADPGAQAISPGDLCGDADVFEHGQFGKNFSDLESPGHAPRHPFMRGQAGDIATVECDAAGSRRKESADQVEERGLAGAIGPDDRAQLALCDVERNVAHRDQIAESLGDVVDVENVHALLR